MRIELSKTVVEEVGDFRIKYYKKNDHSLDGI